jgi:hypothetical protein
VKGLLPPIALLVVFAAVIGAAMWEPWASHERDAEVEWLQSFATWSDRVDVGLEGGDFDAAANCEERYVADVGEPPARLAEAGRIALAGCRRLSRAVTATSGELHGWRDVRHEVLAKLAERHARVASPSPSAELAVRAAPLAGVDAELFCWSGDDWGDLSEDWRLVRSDEFWLAGFADITRNRIHLAPEICEPLERFFGSAYTPSLSAQTLELARALAVLAHEAEHLRSPRAAEAAVECVALQRVRDLVENAGRAPAYGELMAGLAWEVGYPHMPPDYQTTECRDGSTLDVRRDTTVWP